MLSFGRLAASTGILSGSYLLLLIHCYYKLKWLHSLSNDLNTRKLFVMSCFLTSILRVMSFTSLTIFAVGEFDIKSSLEEEDDISKGKDEFFDKSMIVLFDLPDFSIISAYMLLVIVWAESFLMSRRHWMSSVRYRRIWLLGYLLFNTVLYVVQVSLYSLLLLPSIDTEIMTDLIYITLTSINLVLPLIWFVIYVYLTMEFAGFPYSSPSATARLGYLTKLAIIWTLCRVGWGFLALTTALNRLVVSYHRSPLGYSIQMICIFFFTEIFPILFSLKEENLYALADSPQIQTSNVLNTTQTTTTNSRSNPNVQVFNVHDMNSRYSFSGSEDISGMVWMDSNPGGGPLYNPTISEHHMSSMLSPSQISRGRVSLSDPFPPPPASPNFHNWNRKSQAPPSNRVSNDLVSPRSSVTSEHSPRIAGGWLWWLGL